MYAFFEDCNDTGKLQALLGNAGILIPGRREIKRHFPADGQEGAELISIKSLLRYGFWRLTSVGKVQPLTPKQRFAVTSSVHFDVLTVLVALHADSVEFWKGFAWCQCHIV